MIRRIRRFSIRFRFWLLILSFMLLSLTFALFVYFNYLNWMSMGEAIRSSLQEQTRFFNIISTVSILIFLVLSVSFSFYAVMLSKSILSPLKNLVSRVSFPQAQETWSVEGDQSNDEISAFTQSLNLFLERVSINYKSLELGIEQATDALAKRAFYLQAAAEMALDTTSVLDLKDFLDRTVKLIQERLGLYFVGLFILDSNKEFAVFHSGTGDAGKLLLETKHKIKIGGIGTIGMVSASGESRVVNDVKKDFTFQSNPYLGNTRSQVVLPLRIGCDTIGVLDIQSDKENNFEPGIIAVLQIIANQLGLAVQNAVLISQQTGKADLTNRGVERGYHSRGLDWSEEENDIFIGISKLLSPSSEKSPFPEAPRLHDDQINLLYEITAAAAVNHNVQDLLREVAESIKGNLDLDYCDVIWFGREEESAVLHNSAANLDTLGGVFSNSTRQLKVNSPLIEHLQETKRSLEISDLTSNALAVGFNEILRENGISSAVFTPLIIRGELNGLVITGMSAGKYQLQADNVHLLDRVSMLIAEALDVARRYEETNQKVEWERKIRKSGQRIRGTLDIRSVLHKAADELRSVLGVPEVIIRLDQVHPGTALVDRETETDDNHGD